MIGLFISVSFASVYKIVQQCRLPLKGVERSGHLSDCYWTEFGHVRRFKRIFSTIGIHNVDGLNNKIVKEKRGVRGRALLISHALSIVACARKIIWNAANCSYLSSNGNGEHGSFESVIHDPPSNIDSSVSQIFVGVKSKLNNIELLTPGYAWSSCCAPRLCPISCANVS